MIGLDTNILLRWLLLPDEVNVGSSPVEVEKISSVLLAPERIFYVNVIVLAEIAWILEQKLKLSRSLIHEVVQRLLSTTNVRIGNASEVRKAQLGFAASNINFADCLISEINLAAGCGFTLTFDRKASKSAGFRHIDEALEG